MASSFIIASAVSEPCLSPITYCITNKRVWKKCIDLYAVFKDKRRPKEVRQAYEHSGKAFLKLELPSFLSGSKRALKASEVPFCSLFEKKFEKLNVCLCSHFTIAKQNQNLKQGFLLGCSLCQQILSKPPQRTVRFFDLPIFNGFIGYYCCQHANSKKVCNGAWPCRLAK